jgi:hypothetical protein
MHISHEKDVPNSGGHVPQNHRRTLVLTRATWHNFPEDGILHSHRLENLKSYILLVSYNLFHAVAYNM